MCICSASVKIKFLKLQQTAAVPTSTTEFLVHGALLNGWSNSLESTFQSWRMAYITYDTFERMARSRDGIVLHPSYLTGDAIVLLFKPSVMDGHDLLSMPYLLVL